MCDENKVNSSRADVESLLSEVIENEEVVDGELVVSSGSNKCDGYLSSMMRVDVLGKNRHLHFIIKCAPKNADLRKFTPIQMIYEREIKFYTQIYPAMKKFQEERHVLKPFKNVAKCYKTDLTELNELLVLENIRKTGFNLWDKRRPMDENHMQLLLKVYAKLHAVSYAMQEQEPDNFAKLIENFPSVFSPKYTGKEFFDSFAMGLEEVESMFEEEKIVNKIRKLKENVLDYMLYISNNVSKFPTIVHGDCWCNNMMFKYEDPTNPLKPTDVCLLDFQICSYTSPALDLAYFLYANSTKERLGKLDDYIDTYYEHLSSHLQVLGCKSNLISKEQIKSEWGLFSKFGYIMTLLVVKASLANPDEAIDFTDAYETGKQLSDVFFRDFKNKDIMNKKFVDLTRHMYDNGFLDFEK